MNSDIEIAKRQAYEARQNLDYILAGYRHLGKDPSYIYDMKMTLDHYEPLLYRDYNLGFVQIPAIALGLGVIAAITYISAVFQKSWTERKITECEMNKLELVNSNPDWTENEIIAIMGTQCKTPSDGVGDTLDKIRSIIIIGAGAAALIAVLGFFKK